MRKLLDSRPVIAAASVGCVIAGAIACGSEPEVVAITPVGSAPAVVAPAVVATASAPGVVVAPPPGVVVAPPRPSRGGTVVMAGEYPVEVVTHESGQVYAYVVGDVRPPEGAEISVVVPVTGGVRTLELAWEPGETRWGARVRRAEIVPGPIDVIVVAGGARWVGHATTIVIAPAIVVVDTSPAVIVVEHDRGKHKHRKHRGRGHGRGHGHGDVRIRFH